MNITDHLLNTIRWDTTLQPVPVRTPEEEAIHRWDEWFGLVGLGKEWGSIKQACHDTGQNHKQVMMWAEMMELARIGEDDEHGAATTGN